MSLKTFLLHGIDRPAFDPAIVKALELQRVDLRTVHRQWMQIGIRNDAGQVYRLIGVPGGSAWHGALNTMLGLGFVDELSDSRKSKEGCDAIFSRTGSASCDIPS
ncbi:hypothetical protein [Cupriavidus sp. AcVe19-1a]|uniref:hypothetical protein n=1 Tax=Cupriavidus sp. AcVe19-1a TaxID=2821359 RepID=UPI001AE9D940|nr:hypothetical protein [Cupriavidus sp. AcVe19-1a]MBP0633684.1 hypothetical protein [Cupriavidus sp. AcVe19-1a]